MIAMLKTSVDLVKTLYTKELSTSAETRDIANQDVVRGSAQATHDQDTRHISYGYAKQPFNTFLNLPQEIRNHIYYLIFNRPNINHGIFDAEFAKNGVYWINIEGVFNGLLRTCKQTYFECHPSFTSSLRATLRFGELKALSTLPPVVLQGLTRLEINDSSREWYRCVEILPRLSRVDLRYDVNPLGSRSLGHEVKEFDDIVKVKAGHLDEVFVGMARKEFDDEIERLTNGSPLQHSLTFRINLFWWGILQQYAAVRAGFYCFTFDPSTDQIIDTELYNMRSPSGGPLRFEVDANGVERLVTVGETVS